MIWSKIQRFSDLQCGMRAASLTFYTLFSLVPFLALCFGLAKLFDFEKTLTQQLDWLLKGQSETTAQLIHFANTLIHHAHGGTVALLGSLFLFWSLFKVFFILEETLNRLFQCKENRPLWKQLINYSLFVLIAPFVWLSTSIFSVFMHKKIFVILKKIEWLGPYLHYFSLSRVLPLMMITLLVSLAYYILPKAKIRFRDTLWPAFMVALLYHVIQWVYFTFQIGIASQNAVYGSFAAIPLFLLWIELSWHLVLFGSLLCVIKK